jgi:hypothetical protein
VEDLLEQEVVEAATAAEGVVMGEAVAEAITAVALQEAVAVTGLTGVVERLVEALEETQAVGPPQLRVMLAMVAMAAASHLAGRTQAPDARYDRC